MSDENGKNAPVFDFSRVSRQWNKAFAASFRKAAHAQTSVMRPAPEDGDRETMQAHYDRIDAAVDALEALADEQAALIVQVLADVPAEWLLESAPEQIDWSQVASLDYIQSDKYMEILLLIQNGEAQKMVRQAAKK